MDFVGFNLLTNFLLVSLVILGSFIFWISRRQNYFKNHNVPFIKSTPLLGSFSKTVLGKIGFYENVAELYNRPEVKDYPFFGMFVFHKPGLVVNDPELIKRILVKDFVSFSERYASSDVHDPVGYYNLFSAKKAFWKKMRCKLSPFFSSGKLKAMFHLHDKTGKNLNKHIHRKLGEDNKVELEMKELASLYSTDIIASCAYGLEANSLDNPESEFRKAGKAILKMTFRRSIELPAYYMLPQIMKLFRIQAFSKFGTSFIRKTIKHVMDERGKTGTKRNDLIDTFIELKNSDETLTDDMLVAQAAIFFTGGECLRIHITRDRT